VSPFRACAIVPTYNNPRTIEGSVRSLRCHLDYLIVVDDGSDEASRKLIQALGRDDGVEAIHRPENGGKGAAVKDGLELARERGYSHALQVDADGQHRLEDCPKLLEAARSDPMALVLGEPRFDRSIPRARLWARRLTVFWTRVEIGSSAIGDPMCGFRVYPIEAALATRTAANRMDFDPEIAVRMAWAGAPVVRIPTEVRYVSPAEGGVSHFRMIRDNFLITWMHTRLVLGAIVRALRRLLPGDSR